MILLDATRSLFANKLVTDDRVATTIFENLFGYRIGILPIDLDFQVQVISLIAGQILASNIFAVITWYGVVVPMQRHQRLAALLVGLGFVIPLSLLLPFYFINFVDLRSKTLRFGCILIPMLVPFKCIDALFGVESNDRKIRMKTFEHYFYYMGMILLPKFAEKDNDDDKNKSNERVVVPLTMQALIRAHNGFLWWFLVSSLVCQVLSPFNYRPFSENDPDRNPAFDLYPTFQLACIYNTYVQAIALFSTLIFSMYGVAVICCLMGNLQVCDNVFDAQPLFCATSPSDFWGRRWNTLVHHNLKEAIYKPVRSLVGWKWRYSKPVAVMATFVASGLLHEYCWALLFFRTDQERFEGDACQTCYDYGFGKHLIFFGWNGMLLVAEELWLGKMLGDVVGSRLNFLPRQIRSHLVLLTALPVGHLFTEDLLDSGYFSQLQVTLPRLTIERM